MYYGRKMLGLPFTNQEYRSYIFRISGEDKIMIVIKISFYVKLFQELVFVTMNSVCLYTSATFKNSATLSMRMRNFLYESNASLAFFLFMSKYFSVKRAIISNYGRTLVYLVQSFQNLNNDSNLPNRLMIPSL